MSAPIRVMNHTTVRIPERIGDVTSVFVMEGERFGFHPVLKSEVRPAKNWVRK